MAFSWRTIQGTINECGAMMNDKVSIPKNLVRRLERVTLKSGVTPSVLVRTALTNPLDYEEWFLRAVDEGIADLAAGRVFTTRQVLAALDKQRAERGRQKPKTAA